MSISETRSHFCAHYLVSRVNSFPRKHHSKNVIRAMLHIFQRNYERFLVLGSSLEFRERFIYMCIIYVYITYVYTHTDTLARHDSRAWLNDHV